MYPKLSSGGGVADVGAVLVDVPPDIFVGAVLVPVQDDIDEETEALVVVQFVNDEEFEDNNGSQNGLMAQDKVI